MRLADIAEDNVAVRFTPEEASDAVRALDKLIRGRASYTNAANRELESVRLEQKLVLSHCRLEDYAPLIINDLKKANRKIPTELSGTAIAIVRKMDVAITPVKTESSSDRTISSVMQKISERIPLLPSTSINVDMDLVEFCYTCLR